MTYKAIIDSLKTRVGLENLKHNSQISLLDSEYLLFVTTVIQDIQRVIGEIKTTLSKNTVASTETIDLTNLIGRVSDVVIVTSGDENDTILTQTTYEDIKKTDVAEDTPTHWAQNGETLHLYPTPSAIVTLNIIGKAGFTIYAGETTDFLPTSANSITMPDKYIECITLGVLAKIFYDILPLYQDQVRSLRQSQTFSSSMNYRMNGGIN